MKSSNRNVRVFGWENAHEAVSRRPPIPLYTIVARTHMYTYATKVWDLFIVQGPFPVAPCQTLAKPFTLRFATFPSLLERRGGGGGRLTGCGGGVALGGRCHGEVVALGALHPAQRVLRFLVQSSVIRRRRCRRRLGLGGRHGLYAPHLPRESTRSTPRAVVNRKHEKRRQHRCLSRILSLGGCLTAAQCAG
jgi:hypothetical protein